MAPKCSALNLSDQSRCDDEATSLNGLFCQFHSRQCQGLYRGYKTRNARLDALAASPPSYLASNATPLANQTFADVKSEATLRELHSYFMQRHGLLDRVIHARKIHHSRFFSMEMDYGHQHYLDNLQNQKFIVAHALERLERRTAEVMYTKQSWFKWVRECQDEEETQRENEKKKIKREAALFKRHWNQFKLRMKELRAKEDQKRQDKYLEEAYNARMSVEEEEAMWDPIDDVVEDERGTYVDMINMFLLLKQEINKNHEWEELKEGPQERVYRQGRLGDKGADAQTSERGVEYAHNVQLRGTIENPVELAERSAPLPDDEIDRLIEEISEIKHLLFCRLLLSQASLFPAAVRANSVEEFLNDKEVHDSDLRDLCLKMENPGLQEVRDACADLVRGEEDDNENGDVEMLDELVEEKRPGKIWRVGATRRHKKLPEVWNPKRNDQLQKRNQRKRDIMGQGAEGNNGTYIDFGTFDDETEDRGKKMRVKVCGKVIYNYPSEKAMSRGGWLHFCIIAKDSNLLDAGFFPYQDFRDADDMTIYHQSGSRGRDRRAHAVMEARSFLAGHISRNDPASRRLIRYLSMQTHCILLLVRDSKTGRVLVAPRDSELWLLREKSGIGRASKNKWNVIKEVGEKLFEELEATRKWTLSFNDYYDLIVWDVEPGRHYSNVYSVVSQMLYKAHRFRNTPDTYNLAAPLLKTLTRDRDTFRIREIKSGEQVMSIYDDVHHEGTRFKFFDSNKQVMDAPKTLFYNEADALEDKVLFPEEHQGEENGFAVGAEMNKMESLEYEGPDFNRFIHDLDADEELSDSEKVVPEERLRHTCQHDEGSDEDDDEDDDGNEDWQGMVPVPRIQDDDAKQAASFFHRHRNSPTINNSGEDMEDTFMRFLRRESSRVFKEAWHKADLEPCGQQRYADMGDLCKQVDEAIVKRKPLAYIGPMALLDVNPHLHRRVGPDMHEAVAKTAMFFGFITEAFEPEFQEELKDHLIVKQMERAKNLPDRRRHNSNKTMPKEFWDAWKAVKQLGNRVDNFPDDWDRAIRPIIAHLYREGILCSGSWPEMASHAIAGPKADGRDLDLDLYIDFHPMLQDINFGPGMVDPPTLDRLLTRARNFAKDNPNARFAALRLWSSPHFWPLLVSVERREQLAFFDALGRVWQWKFIPKDMPYSEWSMNHQARMRLEPFKHKFGDRVFVKRDLFLVMGVDEKDLFRYATAAVYAVQTDPWRLEVDLWRSFVNVDLAGLEALDPKWLD